MQTPLLSSGKALLSIKAFEDRRDANESYDGKKWGEGYKWGLPAKMEGVAKVSKIILLHGL